MSIEKLVKENQTLLKTVKLLEKEYRKNGKLSTSSDINRIYGKMWENNQELEKLGYKPKSFLKKILTKMNFKDRITKKYNKKATYAGDTKKETKYSESLGINKNFSLNQYTKYSFFKNQLEEEISEIQRKIANSKKEQYNTFKNETYTIDLEDVEELEKQLQKKQEDLNFLRLELVTPRNRKKSRMIENANAITFQAKENYDFNLLDRICHKDWSMLEQKDYTDEEYYNGNIYKNDLSEDEQLECYSFSLKKYLQYKKEDFEYTIDKLMEEYRQENYHELKDLEDEYYKKLLEQKRTEFEEMFFADHKRMSDKRAVNQIQNLMNANIKAWNEVDKFVTLTYSNEYLKHGTNRDQVKKDIRNFIKRINRKYKTKAEYIAVFELQNKRFKSLGDRVWHVHLILFNVPFIDAPKSLTKIKTYKKQIQLIEKLASETEINNENEIYEIQCKIDEETKKTKQFWEYGSFEVEEADDSNLSDYLSKYVSKDFIYREFEDPHETGHRYMRSRGLHEPITLYGDDVDIYDYLDPKENKFYIRSKFGYDHKQYDIYCEQVKYWRDGYLNFSDTESRNSKIAKKMKELTYVFNRYVSILTTQKNIENLTEEEKEFVEIVINDLSSKKYEIIKEFQNIPINDFKLFLLNKFTINRSHKLAEMREEHIKEKYRLNRQRYLIEGSLIGYRKKCNLLEKDTLFTLM